MSHTRTAVRRSITSTPLVVATVLVAVAAILSGRGLAEASQPTAVTVTGRAIVGFDRSVSGAAATAALKSLGVGPGRDLGALHARAIDLPAGVSNALAHTPGVAYVEPDQSRAATVLPSDPYLPTGSGSYSGGQWGVFRTSTPTVWDAIGYGTTVRLAVIDSGVASAHPDLSGQVLTGRNVLDGSSNTNDTDGHGTYVAGVIAAATNNGIGIAGYCGNCRILPVKVTTGGAAYDSNLASGVTWATDNGAKVINLSFAGTTSSTTLGNAVAYARSKGVVVVAAAGNSGCDCATYPANYPGVIAVAASSNLTGDVLQGYSNYGSWVDVAAPSGNLTTSLTDPNTGAQWGYMNVGGTSLAAPVVVGIAGLLLSGYPTATGTNIEQALTSGAHPISGTHQVASGRVDASASLTALGSLLSGTTASPSPSPTSTATATAIPSPSPTSTTSTTASPSPSPTDTTTSSSTSTTTVSGSLNRKVTSRTYPVSTSGGTISTTMSFGCSTLVIAVAGPDGSTLLSTSGPSALDAQTSVPAGTSSVTVSGSSKCSFTLTMTVPT